MLRIDELKLALQRDGLSRVDRVILVLFTFEQPAKVAEIKEKALRAGCTMQTWNIGDILGRARGFSLRLSDGYEVAEKGHERLNELGISKLPPAAAKLAHDLRKHLVNIRDETTRAFVQEAIQCYELGLKRSAIVMSWLAAVGVLYQTVLNERLADFNAEMVRIDNKWKPATTVDDLSKLKEADFLDRLVAIKVIGKNVKTELVGALNLRNGCGHPNSLKVGPNIVAGHIEILILNVFEKFSA